MQDLRAVLTALVAGACLALSAGCGGDDDDGDNGAASGGTGGTTGSGGDSGSSGSSGSGSQEVTPADICPALVEADCPGLATFLPDVETCVAGLPFLAAPCQAEMDDVMECVDEEPSFSCDETTGMPILEGCETEWGGLMVCAANAMTSGSGGSAGGGGAPGGAAGAPGEAGGGGAPGGAAGAPSEAGTAGAS